MTTVHAYRRSAPIEVDLFGQLIAFKPNDKGDIVADVDTGPALDRLLEITEGYRDYNAAPVLEPEPADDDTVIETSPYVLTQEKEDGSGEEETIDLRTLNLELLHKFCTDNDIPFHKQAKEPKLRDTIVAFFKVD